LECDSQTTPQAWSTVALFSSAVADSPGESGVVPPHSKATPLEGVTGKCSKPELHELALSHYSGTDFRLD